MPLPTATQKKNMKKKRKMRRFKPRWLPSLTSKMSGYFSKKIQQQKNDNNKTKTIINTPPWKTCDGPKLAQCGPRGGLFQSANVSSEITFYHDIEIKRNQTMNLADWNRNIYKAQPKPAPVQFVLTEQSKLQHEGKTALQIPPNNHQMNTNFQFIFSSSLSPSWSPLWLPTRLTPSPPTPRPLTPQLTPSPTTT